MEEQTSGFEMEIGRIFLEGFIETYKAGSTVLANSNDETPFKLIGLVGKYIHEKLDQLEGRGIDVSNLREQYDLANKVLRGELN